jgi:hypothetical protein
MLIGLWTVRKRDLFDPVSTFGPGFQKKFLLAPGGDDCHLRDELEGRRGGNV